MSVSRIRPLSSRSASSRSSRRASSSSTWAIASAYSSCASGLTGPSCSRRFCRRSMRAASASRSPSGSGSPAGSGSRPSLVASSESVRADLLGAVARLLGADLGDGDRLGAAVQPGLGGVLGRRARRAGRRRGARRRRGRRRARPGARSGAHLDGLAGGGEGLDEPLRRGGELIVGGEPGTFDGQPALAVAALALRPLGEPALGGECRAELRAAGRDRALVGRLLALVEQPRGVAHGLARLVAGTGRGAGGAVGLVAGGVGGGDGLRSALALGDRGPLGLRRALGGLDQLVAAVALGQQPVLSSARHLAELARERRPDAAGAGHGDAAEVGPEPVELLDDPHVGEQPLGERSGGAVALGADARAERLGAGRG